MFLRLKKINDYSKKKKKCSDFNRFNYELLLDSSNMTNSLLKEIIDSIKLDSEEDLLHLSVIIANLLFDYNEGGWYSAFTWSTSKIPSRYNVLNLTQNKILKIMELLIEKLYVEFHPGGYFGGVKYRSKIRAEDKLVNLARSHFPEGVHISGRFDGKETIILKSSNTKGVKGRTIKGKIIDYKETQDTTRKRNRVQKYNELINETDICMDPEKFIPREHKRPDLEKNQAVRIFNNGSFKEGGRFYDVWWQGLPELERQNILIKSEPVVEIDFKNQSLVLLYAKEGIHYGDKGIDGYKLPNYRNSKVVRAIVKLMFSMSVNCKTDWGVNAALCKHLSNKHKKYAKMMANDEDFPESILDDFNPLIDDLKNFHQPIAHYLSDAKKWGTHIQYWDSCIADEILRLMTKKKIPVLSVHDSFICAISHEEDLIRAIGDAYTRLLKGKPFEFTKAGNLQLTRMFGGIEEPLTIRIGEK